MNVYSVPMLISGILCALLSLITWLFRGRENINRIFSLFTLALAFDAFSFFLWFQYGSVEHIHTWMRITFSLGFFVPLGLVFFFYAFTGYDGTPEERVFGIKAGHFRTASLSTVLITMILAQFTDWIIDVPDTPENIWDLEFGAIGRSMFPLYAVIFVYLFSMAFKSYRRIQEVPRKRFVLILTLGTGCWLLFGYAGAVVFPISSEMWQAISYSGTGMMAVFYFVAIVNYQSDQVHELNLHLERKVIDRTRELKQKNTELQDALDTLKQMQKQVIVQEKMATLGQLVAGLTHEINTPMSAIRSMRDTKSKAVKRLQTALEKGIPPIAGIDREIGKAMEAILEADGVIDRGTERLTEIVTDLKNFSRLDEAERTVADIHQGLDSALGLIRHDLLTNIEVVRDYGEIPPFVCHPRELNQVFLHLLMNACQAIDARGRITVTTRRKENRVHVSIRDTGRGIRQEDLGSIFDPHFTTRDSVVRTRLGLSICYQIVREHHGEITVESRPGRGSVFTVILPMTGLSEER